MTHPREWHEARQSGIGASEVAAIIGLSPWKSARQVQREKLEPVQDEPPMRLKLWLGLRLEPVIAELTAEELGVRLVRPPKRYRHPFAPLHCELDYKVVGLREHVECKVANFGEDWGETGSTVIPKHYYPQVQAQLAVTGNVAATVAALYHGQELRLYRIERNETYIDDLVTFVSEWWQRHIVEGIEVPPTALDSDDIKRRHRFAPNGEDEVELIATPELTLTIEQLRVAREAAKAAANEQAALENVVKEAMGEAGKLIGPGVSITWRNSKDSTTVAWELVASGYRSLAEDHGVDAERLDALVSLYSDTAPGPRVFRPTWKGDKG